jgi:catechol 2,3-dioxygenase-like lactoylglutathione lyase family enzyme
MTNMLRNLNHMNIIVQDMMRARAFIEGFLGLRRHSTFESAYIIGDEDPLLVVLEFPKARTPDLAHDHHHRRRGITLVVDSLPELCKKSLAFGLSLFIIKSDGSEIPLRQATRDDFDAVAAIGVRDHDANLWRFVQA